MQLRVPLYDFQEAGVQFAVSRQYSLNGDKMGLGKTAQALALACRVQAQKILVICPAFLTINWQNEITKFLGEENVRHFTVVSYDSLTRIKSFEPFDLVICDEIHYVKNLDAARTKLLHARMQDAPPKYFIGLSGTPIKNRVPEFYSLLKLVSYGGRYPEFHRYTGSAWLFAKEFTNQKLVKIGSRKFTKFEGVKNVDELRSLIRPVYIRRKTEEVISLPDQVRQEVLIAEKSKTDELLKAAWESYEGKKDAKVFSSGKAVSALAKVPFTVELAKEMLPEAGAIVIYTDHVQAAKKIHNEFHPDESRYVTGETSIKFRSQVVDALNSGQIKVLVSTIGSLSVGVNLTGCNYMIFNDFPWVPADMEQAEARIHRIGQSKKCFYYYVLASKYDQVIYRTLLKKRALIAEVGT